MTDVLPAAHDVDMELHNVPGPVYQALLDKDRFEVPPILHERYPWPKDLEHSVPRDRYLSDEIHELEHRRMWSRCWQMACRVDNVRDIGDHILYEINDLQFIVMRVDEDTIKAFPNTCLHRGRTLRTCGGNVGRIRCPYHGFTWEIDGALHSVPTEWDFRDQIDRADWHLPEVSVAVWGGFVFINPDPDAPPFAQHLGDLARHFDRVPLDDWTVAAHAAQYVDANWKLGLEAFIEAAHVHATHPQTLTGTDPCNSQYDLFDNSLRIITPFGVPSVMVDTEPPPSEQRKMDGMMGRKSTTTSVVDVPAGVHARDMFADIQRGRMKKAGLRPEYADAEMVDLQTYYLFPNLIILGGPRGTILRFRPAGRPDRSIVEIIGLAPPRPGKEPRDAPEVAWIDEDKPFSSDKRFADYELVDQDMGNVQASQQAMSRLRDRPLTLSRYQEASIAYFHKLLYNDWLG
jgi:phenylpropionate dioxygenase-like ring-hydroxylating dioxygenase large terminal subunit